MKKVGQIRNEAFFRKNNTTAVSYSKIFRSARASGSLNLSTKGIVDIPLEVFALNEYLEEDEKFWEINPLTKLDLSHNSIALIPDNITSLVELVSIKLRNNKLTEVSVAFSSLRSLKHMDLSNNKIRSILVDFEYLIDLRECLLSCNEITEFPISICFNTKLSSLIINDNLITNVPVEIIHLQSIIHLDLSNNRISHIPPSIGELTTLQILDLHKNNLTTLPSLHRINHLQLLDVTENKISEIPVLPQNGVNRLHLGFNAIRNLPSTFFTYLHEISPENAVFELHFENNKIQQISEEIAQLRYLKVLDMTNNELGDLPYSLGYMSALQRIVLDGNPLRSIRRSLLVESTQKLKTYLRTRGAMPACLVGTKVDYVDESEEVNGHRQSGYSLEVEERFRNMNGDVLNLSSLRLSSMPPNWIHHISRLQSVESLETSINVCKLDISGNNFTEIPSEIFQVHKLMSLDIQCNPLVQLHNINSMQGSISNQLKYLNVNECNISNELLDGLLITFQCPNTNPIPKNGNTTTGYRQQVGGNEHHPKSNNLNISGLGLSCLQSSHNKLNIFPVHIILYHPFIAEINLSYNKLTSIENVDFSVLQNLEIIDISNNRITSLGNLFTCMKLSSLMANNNDITSIPPQFVHCQSLNTFNIYGNPQKTVRSAVISQGCGAIMKALRIKLTDEPAPSVIATLDRGRSDSQGAPHSKAPDLPQTPLPQSAHLNPRSSMPPAVQHTRYAADADIHSMNQREQTATMSSNASMSVVSGNSGRNVVMTGTIQDANSYSNNNSTSRLLQPKNTPQIQQTRHSNEDYGQQANALKIDMLERDVARLEIVLSDCSLTESKRFATKKEMAKVRANLIRLKRGNES